MSPKSYAETVETVALAALHMAGLTLPKAIALKDMKRSYSACMAHQKWLLHNGYITRRASLREAVEALRTARRAGYEYVPLTEKGLQEALGLRPLTLEDPRLDPGVFVSTVDPLESLLPQGGAVTTAITGTRRMTAYGLRMTNDMVAGLPAGTSVVSGLAWGVQVSAIRAAARRGLPVIAFMACGPGEVYPRDNADLYERLRHTHGCAVATSRFPGQAPLPHGVLLKSHWLAAAGRVMVPESAPGGGAMTVARLARATGGEVWAAPGRADDELSLGCNRLIQEGTAGLYFACSD